MRRKATASCRFGFTLIELLVVIAIIAILAAILFPVFAKARQRAQTATCQSNLNQFGKAAMMYEQDNGETILPGNLWDIGDWDHPAVPAKGELAYYGGDWLSLINPYLKTLNKSATWSLDQSLLCPVPPKVSDVNLRRPYGYNIYYLGMGVYPDSSAKGRCYSLGAVTSPSNTVRISEIWNFASNWGSLYCYPPVVGSWALSYCYPPGFHTGTVGGGNTPAAATERLKGMNNVLWMDGHISSVSGNKLLKAGGYAYTDAYFRLRKLPTDGI